VKLNYKGAGNVGTTVTIDKGNIASGSTALMVGSGIPPAKNAGYPGGVPIINNGSNSGGSGLTNFEQYLSTPTKTINKGNISIQQNQMSASVKKSSP